MAYGGLKPMRRSHSITGADMADRIAAHVFIDGKCAHCGVEASSADKTCIWRDAPPRPKPTSIFHDLSEIGARLKEIQTQEDAALAGRNIPEPADF